METLSMDIGRQVKRIIIVVPMIGLVAGSVLYHGGQPGWARQFWIAATLPVLAGLCIDIVTSLRRGEFGLDIVAALSMNVALLFGEELAAAVVALMYAGG